MNALVVPTNSADRLAEFLGAWAPWPWDRIIVVQDAPGADVHVPHTLETVAAERLEVFSWAEIDTMLSDPSIISRQDSAIRSFGFWHAWATGAEIIFTLDDDCFPTEDDFVALHRDNLYRTPAWQSSVPGMRVRGLPYDNAGILRDVHVSMGLWRGCPDIDSVMTLAGGQSAVSVTETGTRVMPAAQYFPLSGMNLAFTREVACLMYFPPMGLGQPYRRFDDIWCGLVVQRICRHLGYPIVCGRPMVDHRRASNPFVNLVKEAPGIVTNEHIWETIDAVELSEDHPRSCMEEMGAALRASDNEYTARWGHAISSWCALFEVAHDPLGAAAAADE